MTPLHKAAIRGHVDTVQCLLDKRADIHIKDDDGVSEWNYTADCDSEFVLVLFPDTWQTFLHPYLMNA